MKLNYFVLGALYSAVLISVDKHLAQALTSTTTTRDSTTSRIPTTKPATPASPPYTLPPVTTQCAICDSPPEVCELSYTTVPCRPPNNYCLNELQNNIDGSRTLMRRCASFDDCYQLWWRNTSDNHKCMRFDSNYVETSSFSCSYCCIKDNCNEPVRPKKSELYVAHILG